MGIKLQHYMIHQQVLYFVVAGQYGHYNKFSSTNGNILSVVFVKSFHPTIICYIFVFFVFFFFLYENSKRKQMQKITMYSKIQKNIKKKTNTWTRFKKCFEKQKDFKFQTKYERTRITSYQTLIFISSIPSFQNY